MKRPLYLGTAADAVRLNGPALQIAMSGEADQSVPLRLISRIVARSGPEWASAAFAACLADGIPITLLHRDGSLLATCVPAATSVDSLAEQLDRLEHEPGGPDAFANWTRSEQRRAILNLVRSTWFRTSAPCSDPPDLRAEVVP